MTVVKPAIPLLALLLLAPAALGGAGESVIVRTYETGAVNLRVNLVDLVGITSDGSIDHGGVQIPAAQFPVGSALAGIALRDEAGTRVRGLACQDLDGDALCGEADAGEARVAFCDDLTPANVISDAGHRFYGGAAIVVFVFASPGHVSIANPASSGAVLCPDGAGNAATTGTVTVTLVP